METVEIVRDANGQIDHTIMHNQVTEGWAEGVARLQVKAIDPEVKDLQEERYYEKTSMAYKVIESRDRQLGEEGKTVADYLTHSSIIKRELEGKSVTKDDGSKVDGLHYMSDYADKTRAWRTPKRMYILSIAKQIGNQSIVEKLTKYNIESKRELTKDDIDGVTDLLQQAGFTQTKASDTVSELVTKIQEENEFFDAIPEKLGYGKEKTSERLTVQELLEGSETEIRKGTMTKQQQIINANLAKIAQKDSKTQNEDSDQSLDK